MASKGALYLSTSHLWTPQLVFLCFLLLAVCRSSARTRSQEKWFHTIDVETFRFKNGHDASKCRGQQLERSNPERSENVEGGVTIGLNHIHGPCSPLRPRESSWSQIVLERLEGDKSRVNAIKSRIAARNGIANINSKGANVPVEAGNKYHTPQYIVTVGFGTPVKNFLLEIDTGSDVTWIQCQPCSKPDGCYWQADPIFNPKQSSSYKRLGCPSPQCKILTESTGNISPCSTNNECIYGIQYGDDSTSQGDFGQETLTFASDSFPNFSFGCGHTSKGTFNGTAGILGLGRNPISFPSQTKSKYGGQFSYCLPDFNSAKASGSLSLGQGSIPSSAVFTPLLSNPKAPSYYYLRLTDISVGGERLSVPYDPFQPSADGGGTIIDSGTLITQLTQPAYDALKASFRNKTTHLRSAHPFSLFDTCYNLTGQTQVQVPNITFHFQPNCDVDVNAIGILIPVNYDGTYVCLAFAPVEGDLSIIGSFQQQRLRVAYDTRTQRIGFAPQSCSY
eukprot:Gb_26345 [translate_table: standard]